MKIADALELIKSLGREKARLENLVQEKSWSYVRTERQPDTQFVPNFDVEKTNEKIQLLDKRIRKLSRAINATNNLQDVIGIDDSEYSDWL